MSNLKCKKHNRRVIVSVTRFRHITTVVHKTGDYSRCDSEKFEIGTQTYTAAQIVTNRS